LNDKDDDKNPAQMIHPQCDMPDFIISIDIFLPEQINVFEDADCISKVNPMFSEIDFSFSSMPFVGHGHSHCMHK